MRFGRKIPAADKSYLTQLVCCCKGRTQADRSRETSVQRFHGGSTSGRDGPQTVAYSLLWASISLLAGAFCASLGETTGGRQRDHIVVVWQNRATPVFCRFPRPYDPRCRHQDGLARFISIQSKEAYRAFDSTFDAGRANFDHNSCRTFQSLRNAREGWPAGREAP